MSKKNKAKPAAAVALTLAGAPLTMSFNINDLCDAETLSGRTFGEIINQLRAGLPLTTTKALLQVGLKLDGNRLIGDQVIAAIEENGMDATYSALAVELGAWIKRNWP